MEFRIGVHLGEVTREGDRVCGDGVSIAARLELSSPEMVFLTAGELAYFLHDLNGAARLIRQRHAGQLASREGAPWLRDTATRFSRSLRAHVAWARSDALAALALLDGADRLGGEYFRRVGWQVASPLEQLPDRFLCARALAEAGRLDEALAWYRSLGEGALGAYAPLGLLEGARIYENLRRLAALRNPG